MGMNRLYTGPNSVSHNASISTSLSPSKHCENIFQWADVGIEVREREREGEKSRERRIIVTMGLVLQHHDEGFYSL